MGFTGAFRQGGDGICIALEFEQPGSYSLKDSHHTWSNVTWGSRAAVAACFLFPSSPGPFHSVWHCGPWNLAPLLPCAAGGLDDDPPRCVFFLDSCPPIQFLHKILPLGFLLRQLTVAPGLAPWVSRTTAALFCGPFAAHFSTTSRNFLNVHHSPPWTKQPNFV